MNHVRVISNLHRIQASPGYREAAHYVHEQLQSYGLQSKIVSFPADPSVYFGNYRSFREWTPREAELEMVYPFKKRLSRFTEVELSVIQRSTSITPEDVEGELVHVPNAEALEVYKGIDVRGKWVLAQGSPMRIHELAVVKHGALGIILDNMTPYPPIRSRIELADAIQYTSYWWHDEETTGMGFAVSPRVGDELRRLCSEGTVRLKGRVDSDLKVGQFENIEAFIPGETEEEVLLVSHLCHPKPGANDNASGPSTLLETARILQRLIDRGELPRPKRGLRFLMMPEMTGTHAYVELHPDRIRKTVAALNLDMVGANLKLTEGPLTIEKSSRALPSYTAELAYGIFTEVAQDIQNLSNTFKYSMTPHVLTPFSGGSDHYILADPGIGIPCPMMITWPDKYYHTTLDKIENLDPKLMQKVAITSAAYMMWIANAGVNEVLGLCHRLALGFATDLDGVREAVTGGMSKDMAARKLAFLKERREADMRSMDRLIAPEDMGEWSLGLKAQLGLVQAMYDHSGLEVLMQRETSGVAEVLGHAGEEAAPLNGQGASLSVDDSSDGGTPFGSTRASSDWDRVWVQVNPGPVPLSGHLGRLSESEREKWHELEKSTPHTYVASTLLSYWMDGQRTLRQVADAVELESGWRQNTYTLAYAELLHKLNLIREVN